MGCGNSYNICDINKDGYVMEPLPPKVKDVCDTCKSKLEIRHDDSEEVKLSFILRLYLLECKNMSRRRSLYYLNTKNKEFWLISKSRKGKKITQDFKKS